jgi:alkylation response protein AidB-like acyl-CoA dehydrogenase
MARGLLHVEHRHDQRQVAWTSSRRLRRHASSAAEIRVRRTCRLGGGTLNAKMIRTPAAAGPRCCADAEQHQLAQAMRSLLRDDSLSLPLPGHGETSQRHRRLAEIARHDLTLARVIEAHTDALAILAEAGRDPLESALYGVWASDGPGGQLQLVPTDGAYELRGVKQYCSGSTFLDAALVTAHHGDELWLVDVPLADADLTIDTSVWKTEAFRATATGSVTFHNVPVRPNQLIGGDRFYLERPGFWHGAIGPAACWAGGALGLIDAAMALRRANPHVLAHLGALEAMRWALEALLDQAGRQIDADPTDTANLRQRRALSVRHLVERLCTEIMDHFGRATGPAALAFDADASQRYAELTLYIRQCHGERDLQTLAECSRT